MRVKKWMRGGGRWEGWRGGEKNKWKEEGRDEGRGRGLLNAKGGAIFLAMHSTCKWEGMCNKKRVWCF